MARLKEEIWPLRWEVSGEFPATVGAEGSRAGNPAVAVLTVNHLRSPISWFTGTSRLGRRWAVWIIVRLHWTSIVVDYCQGPEKQEQNDKNSKIVIPLIAHSSNPDCDGNIFR